MKKKFLLSLVIAAGLGITGFSTNANAGNVKDTSYKFYFSPSGSIAHTEARPKYDATPAYMKFGWIQDGAGGYRVKVVDKSCHDFSRFWWSRDFDEYVPSGTESWISSYAYEDRGYGVQVRLEAEGSGGSGMWSTGGLWSPDSVKR